MIVPIFGFANAGVVLAGSGAVLDGVGIPACVQSAHRAVAELTG